MLVSAITIARLNVDKFIGAAGGKHRFLHAFWVSRDPKRELLATSRPSMHFG